MLRARNRHSDSARRFSPLGTYRELGRPVSYGAPVDYYQQMLNEQRELQNEMAHAMRAVHASISSSCYHGFRYGIGSRDNTPGTRASASSSAAEPGEGEGEVWEGNEGERGGAGERMVYEREYGDGAEHWGHEGSRWSCKGQNVVRLDVVASG
ncbi:hypothetical protein RhiJN_14426 [Ceratobasidium sp. AG-Ba]|nr:hypothetical protein RhiJN_14426 [Ceratobasidium sp. AG-Ba]